MDNSIWITFLVLDNFLWLLINQSLRAQFTLGTLISEFLILQAKNRIFLGKCLLPGSLEHLMNSPLAFPEIFLCFKYIFCKLQSLYKLVVPILKEAGITGNLSICILTLPLPGDISISPLNSNFLKPWHTIATALIIWHSFPSPRIMYDIFLFSVELYKN